MAENLHTVSPAWCTFTLVKKCKGQKYVITWRFTVGRYVDFSNWLWAKCMLFSCAYLFVCVFVCVCPCVLFQWAVISKAMNFLSRKSHHCSFCINQRVIGCQLEQHLNQCLQVFLTIRQTIFWHHNTIPDKGRCACYTPYSDVSVVHFNQLVMESNSDGQICWWNSKLHSSYPTNSSLQAEICSCSLIPDNPSQRCRVILYEVRRTSLHLLFIDLSSFPPLQLPLSAGPPIFTFFPPFSFIRVSQWRLSRQSLTVPAAQTVYLA